MAPAHKLSRVDDTMVALQEIIRDSREAAQDKLPAETALQQRLSVSRSTLREALARLEAMGEIARRGRAGTVITGLQGETSTSPELLRYPVHLVLSLSEFLTNAGVNYEVREVRILKQDASRDVVSTFGLHQGDEVYVATRIYEINGVAAAHLQHVLPSTPGGPTLRIEYLTEGVVTFLENIQQVMISRVHSTISAEPVDETLATSLGLAPGSPVLVMRTRIFGMDESTLALGCLTFRSDQLSLSVSATGHWGFEREPHDLVGALRQRTPRVTTNMGGPR